jgi:hypothetical protein
MLYRHPMPTSLQATLNDLAATFADSILDAIRGVSLDDLISANGQARGSGRPSRSPAMTAEAPSAAKRPRATGRLARRSPEDIAAALVQVVSLVKKRKEGLRAEQIRNELGLQAKEMPRVLKEGIDRKTLRSRGQKRATTYFAT